jgi:hypothetical protein
MNKFYGESLVFPCEIPSETHQKLQLLIEILILRQRIDGCRCITFRCRGMLT